MSFIAELRRRNVIRVGLAYGVIGWILAQIAEFAFENFGAPEWVLKSFVVVLLLGMPLALFFAWAFELTPDGVKLEKDVDRSGSITAKTGRKLDYFIIAALVMALGYFVWERQPGDDVPQGARIQSDESVAEVATIPAGNPRSQSIAVLPFVNMSSDQEQEWFSDGLTEEILNALARTPDLLVAARTSSFKFKNSNEDIPTIADELGVAHVLEGSVRSGKDQLRITAQLIRAEDGFHLWSQTYDRNPDDVIAIQTEIAVEIATALETAMDPEALARMLSAGTDSVPAFNAYLRGLAANASTVSTGDAYTFTTARESHEQAIELDPEFALAHWELARFWGIQLQSNNIVSGIVDEPAEEMMRLFDTSIEQAIRYEEDPVNQLRYRVEQELYNDRYQRALRLNTEYLKQRPNDQRAQNEQLNLLVDMNMQAELFAAMEDFSSRDGYDIVVANSSITFSLVSDDDEFIREFAKDAMQRVGQSTFVQYQAHRALLWAGDIDGAAQLLPDLLASDLPKSSRDLVALRQACGENQRTDAERIYDQLMAENEDNHSILWLSHLVKGHDDLALQVLQDFVEERGAGALTDYLSYAFFDPRPFPNLMQILSANGIEPREPKKLPYRCST